MCSFRLLRKSKNSKFLFEAIIELPNLIDLWDEKDSLIFMNKASKKINERGIKIRLGMTWEEVKEYKTLTKIKKFLKKFSKESLDANLKI